MNTINHNPTRPAYRPFSESVSEVPTADVGDCLIDACGYLVAATPEKTEDEQGDLRSTSSEDFDVLPPSDADGNDTLYLGWYDRGAWALPNEEEAEERFEDLRGVWS